MIARCQRTSPVPLPAKFSALRSPAAAARLTHLFRDPVERLVLHCVVFSCTLPAPDTADAGIHLEHGHFSRTSNCQNRPPPPQVQHSACGQGGGGLCQSLHSVCGWTGRAQIQLLFENFWGVNWNDLINWSIWSVMGRVQLKGK